MIEVDQPTMFPESLTVAVSSRDDGTMLDRSTGSFQDDSDVERRSVFCRKASIEYGDCVYQIISYGNDASYDVIRCVDTPNVTPGVAADVLYTERAGIGLFLPTADCVGTVLYDTERGALALAHLGRHASVAKTMNRVVEWFIRQGSDPVDMLIWMAPSIGRDDYVMSYFDPLDDPDWRGFATVNDDGIHLDLAGFNRDLAIRAGVPADNIYTSLVNTAKTDTYYSHSRGDVNGRFAVVAMMR